MNPADSQPPKLKEQAMSLAEILRLIRGAGKVPAERDSFYNIIRTFDDDGGAAPDHAAAERAA